MLRNLFEPQPQAGDRPQRLAYGLRAALWGVWTLAVASGGYLGWRADTLAGRSQNLLGMGISATMVGVIGLIVLTLIEIRLEPWRFDE
jgi:hypothetical protein